MQYQNLPFNNTINTITAATTTTTTTMTEITKVSDLYWIRTTADAIDGITQLMRHQIDKAVQEKTPPNSPVSGDRLTRNAFLSLLTPVDQRAVFLHLVKDKMFWPRIRTLIGSPPFAFLRGSDDTVLRPAGIARGRIHMATTENDISSYSLFGSSQFVDEAQRDYKVVARCMNERGLSHADGDHVLHSNLLPYVDIEPGQCIAVEIRLKKRNLSTRISIMRGAMRGVSRESVVFPRVGQTITLEPNTNLRHICTTFVFVVLRSPHMRSSRSSVARLIGRVVQK